MAIASFTRIGLTVAIPLTDTQPYDLVVGGADGLDRVQVKTTTMRGPHGHYRVTVQSIGRNNSGTVRRKFDANAYEWLFVVCGDACCYLVPSSAVTAQTVFDLTRSYDRFMLTDEESG